MDFIIKKNDSLNFHKHFGLSSGVGKSYPLLLETIPDGPFTILDFGCGKGGTIQWLSHNRKQAIIAGYDCYVPKYDNHELLKRKCARYGYSARHYEEVLSSHIVL